LRLLLNPKEARDARTNARHPVGAVDHQHLYVDFHQCPGV